jgi:hypothetical protein
MRAMTLLRQPLVRLFAIKLGIGVAALVLLLGGLFALNPGGLRDLVLGNPAMALALGAVLLGSLVAFGAVAIGAAVLMIGREERQPGCHYHGDVM